MIFSKTILSSYFLLFLSIYEVMALVSPQTQEYQIGQMEKIKLKFEQQSQNFEKSMILLQQPTETIISQNDQNKITNQKLIRSSAEKNNIQQNKIFYVLSPTPSPKIAQFNMNQFFQKFMQGFQQMTNSLMGGPSIQNNPPRPVPRNNPPEYQDSPPNPNQNLRNQQKTIQRKQIPQNIDRNLTTQRKDLQKLILPPALNNTQANRPRTINTTVDRGLKAKIGSSTQDQIKKQVLRDQSLNITQNLNKTISNGLQKNGSTLNKTSITTSPTTQNITKNQSIRTSSRSSSTSSIQASNNSKNNGVVNFNQQTQTKFLSETKKQQKQSPLPPAVPQNKTVISPEISNRKIQSQQSFNQVFTRSIDKNDNFSLNIEQARKQINQIFNNFTLGTQNTTKSKYIDNPPPKPRQKRKKEIISKQFDGIGLYQRVPLVFVQGQVYRFSGIVLNPSLVASQGPVKINFITAILSDRFGENQFKCTQELQKNLQFQMSCKMQKAGVYYLSLFAGLYGQSTRRPRNVMARSRIPPLSFSQPPNPINVRLEVIDNNLYVMWDSTAGLTNLTIYQQNNRKQYILSNFHQKFKLPFIDFKQFDPTVTFIEVSHAQTTDGSLAFIQSDFGSIVKISFKATHHAFQQYIEDVINLKNEIPWKLNLGDRLKISGSFKDDIKNEVYVIEPDLNIRKLYFTQQRIPMIRSGTPISVDITLVKEGTHILEINNMAGMALINRPIYVGESYPLLPDYRDEAPLVLVFKPNQVVDTQRIFEDYYQRTTQKLDKRQPGPSSSVDQKRQYMLTLLNGLRKKHGVPPVELSEQLNKIAQSHSDDMARKNYFSHTSLNGDGPGDRARKMGFYNSIGENIAQARYLTEAHLGLQRSAGHLYNSVSKGWMRVGIGITRNNNGDYLVSFSFSSRDYKTYPITPAQQQNIKKQLFNIVKEKNPSIIRQNTKLSADIDRWMQLGKDPKLLQQILRRNGYRGSMTASSFTFSKTEGWEDQLSKADFLDVPQKYKEIGTGIIKADDSGNLQGFVIFV